MSDLSPATPPEGHDLQYLRDVFTGHDPADRPNLFRRQSEPLPQRMTGQKRRSAANFRRSGSATVGALRPGNTRWVLPCAAAAVVVGIAVGLTAFLLPRTHDVAAAAELTVTGQIADVGGVRFPVSPGRTVAVTGSDSTAVTVCVAVRPAAHCAGTRLILAVPDRSGDTAILNTPDPMLGALCPGRSNRMVMTDDHNPIDIAGRPGIHYWSRCSGSPATDHLWELDDLSLEIYAPPDQDSAQSARIIAGLDLTHWPHHRGPQAAFLLRGTSAPNT